MGCDFEFETAGAISPFILVCRSFEVSDLGLEQFFLKWLFFVVLDLRYEVLDLKYGTKSMRAIQRLIKISVQRLELWRREKREDKMR